MTYSFTSEAIKLRKKQFIIFASIIFFYIFVVLPFHYISLRGMRAPSEALVLKGTCFLIFLIVVLIYSLKRIIRDSRSYQLELIEDEIHFINERLTRKIPFASVKRVTVYENPTKIFLRTNKDLFVIYGFERMDEILKSIEIKVNPIILKKKTRIIDEGKSSSLIMVGIGFGVLFRLPFLIPQFSPDVVRGLILLLAFGAGIRFTFFVPINTRRDSPKIIGLVFFAFGMFYLLGTILKLINGKF